MIALSGVIFGIFVVSLLLFIGMGNYLLLSQKAGVYPPKRILIKKAGVLGAGGAIFLIVGLLFFIINT